MATPYQIKILPSQTGLLKVDQTAEAAEKATELLQQDLQDHHVFFNQFGFHNHIVHHILTLYGTGADAASLTAGYKGNTNYQRPAQPPSLDVADSLADWPTAQKHLGDEARYADFLLFYQREIERLGDWREALKVHLFNRGDSRADDLFQRMFAGFLHPLIQLMYGIEWDQPAVVAEGLAQAAVHGNRLREYLVEAERRADERRGSGKMPAVLELMDEARGNEKLKMSADWKDDNKIYDGVLVRAPEEAIELTSKVWIDPGELDERTAEMFHAAVCVAAGAAVREGKERRVDFYLMHHVNSSPIHLALNSQDWLPVEAKVRILEWKIRLDIIQYIARRCPPLLFDDAAAYKPRDQNLVAQNIDLLSRFHTIDDDGHTIKLARAIQLCHDLVQKYAGRDWLRIRDEEQWVRISYLVLDSAEVPSGVRWARGAGFDEAWKEIPDQK